MPQTLLAFLAMMVATMAAFNQQSAVLRSQETMIRSELEIMANAVALDQMETGPGSMDWDDLLTLDGASTTQTFAVATNTVQFSLALSAHYVDDTGTVSGSPTDIIEVSIAVTHSRYNFPLVTHARMFMD
jgi:hypothetical protein